MKIAFISTLFGQDHGGSEALWMQLAAYIKSQSHTVNAYVYEKQVIHPILQDIMDKGVAVTFRKRAVIPSSLTGKISFAVKRKISGSNPYDAITSFRPDIIYVSQAGSVDAANDQNLREFLTGIATPYFINPQHVSELDMVPIPALTPHVRKIFDGAKGLIFVAKRNQEVLYKKWGVSNPNSFITVNPINVLSPAHVQSDTTGVVKFATVAALNCEQKGQDILMEVLGQEKWKARKWVWNLYGSGPDKEKLARQAASLGIGERVFFRGFVDNIKKVWLENNIQLFPTLSEGMPIAVLESLACGIPVVATDIGGNTEWIDDGDNGFIAEKPDVSSLDAALERAWKVKEHWQVMGARGHSRFMSQYNFNYLEDIYKFITAGR